MAFVIGSWDSARAAGLTVIDDDTAVSGGVSNDYDAPSVITGALSDAKYTVQVGDTDTFSAGGLTVSGVGVVTGTLDVQGTLMNTADPAEAIVVGDNGVLRIDNGGLIANEGRITFGSGSLFSQAGTGAFDNGSGSVSILTANAGFSDLMAAINAAAGTNAGNSVGDIAITGDLSGSLVLNNARAGSVSITGGLAGNNINALDAEVILSTNGVDPYVGGNVAGGSVSLIDGVAVEFGNLTSTVGDIALNNSGATAITGSIDSAGKAVVGASSGSETVINGNVTAAGDIGLGNSSERTVVDGDIESAGGSVSIFGGGADGVVIGNSPTTGNISVGAGVYVESATTVEIAGNVESGSGAVNIGGATGTAIGGNVAANGANAQVILGDGASNTTVGGGISASGAGSTVFVAGVDVSVGAGISAGGGITVNNTGDLDVIGDIFSGSGTVAVGAVPGGGYTNVEGSVSGSRDVSVGNANAATTVEGDVTSGLGGVYILGNGAAISAGSASGNVSASGDVEITSGAGIDVDGYVDSTSGVVALASAGNTNIGGGVSALGDDGAIFITAADARVGGDMEADGDVRITSGAGIGVGGYVDSASGVVVVTSAGNTNIGGGVSALGDDGTIFITAADATVGGGLNAHGDIVVNNAGAMDVGGGVISNTGSVNAGTLGSGRTNVDGYVMASGAVSLGNASGATTVAGDVTSTADRVAIAGNGVAIGSGVGTGNVGANGNVLIASGAAAVVDGNISSSAGAVSVAGVSSTTIGGVVTTFGANGAIAVGAAASATTVGGAISASGAGSTVLVAGSSVSTKGISANGNIAVNNTLTALVEGNVRSETGTVVIGHLGAGATTVNGTIVTAGAAGDITLGNAAGNTLVTGAVTSGRDLNIVGGGQHTMRGDVTAAGTINVAGDTVFERNVTGDIVTGYTGYHGASEVRGRHVGDLTVNAGDTHIIAAGGSFSGGSIVNRGAVSGNGNAVIESGEAFLNNGTYTVGTYNPATGNGVLDFQAGSTYNPASAGSLVNNGLVRGDVAMAGGSLADLAYDTTMNAGSAFDIYAGSPAGSGVGLIGHDIVFDAAKTTAGSSVNIHDNPAYGLALAAGVEIDAGKSNLNLAEGSLLVMRDGSVLATHQASLAGFTAWEGSSLRVSPGAVATIDAPFVTFMGESASGYGAIVELESDSVLSIENAGSVIFGAGAAVWADAGTGQALGRIDTNDGDVILEGDVWVGLTGDRIDLVGQYLLDHGTGALDTLSGDFVSDDYYLVYLDGKVYVAASRESAVDITADIFTGTKYDGLSVNKINGGLLTDAVLADPYTDARTVLAIGRGMAALEDWAVTYGMYDEAWIGFGQLYGEYAAYSSQLLRESNQAFWNSESQRFAVKQNARLSERRGSVYGVDDEGAYTLVRTANGVDVRTGAATVWAEGYGAWSRQRNRHNIHGYNYDSGGFNIGVDYTTGRIDLSLFGGYADASLKLRDLATKYDADIMNLGVTAAYTHDSGFYGKLMAGYGHGWNDYDAHWALGGEYRGSFDNNAWTAGGELGYLGQTSFMNVIPSVGVAFTHYSQDGWEESHTGAPAGAPSVPHWFKKRRLNTVDIPVGLRLSKAFSVGAAEIAPEVRGEWIYAARRDGAGIDMGYSGGDRTATMYGVDPGHTRWQVGGGVKARFGQGWDANVDYNLTVRNKYTTHNVTASLGCSF